MDIARIARTALFLVLVADVATAQARWVTLVGLGNPRIDADSTTSRRHEGHLDVWVRDRYSTPRNLTPQATTKHLYVETVERWAIDCAARRYQVSAAVYHSASGEVVQSTNDGEAAASWSEPIPETVGEIAVDSVCAKEGLFDGSYAQALSAYRSRWVLIDSQRVLECQAADRPGISAPCRNLKSLKGTGAQVERERWRLKSVIDSLIGNTWPDLPSTRSTRAGRPTP
jgi:hypothetical protein